MTRPLRIGSRKSRLALVQSEWVASEIQSKTGRPCEIVKIVTKGDVTLDRSLPEIGGKGLFTLELEERLLDGSIDIAVHSLKDLPTQLGPGLAVGAVSEREDPRDAIATRDGGGLDSLPAGARVGSGSLRRRAQLLQLRKDITLLDIRGNVPTRLEKLDRGDYDAVILAAAGLSRLGLAERASDYFPTDAMVPAPGQGALGIECRDGDDETVALLGAVHHPGTAVAVALERGILERLGGGCNTPVGVYASGDGDGVSVTAIVSDPEGTRLLRETGNGYSARWETLADDVVSRLRASGADDIIRLSGDEG